MADSAMADELANVAERNPAAKFIDPIARDLFIDNKKPHVPGHKVFDICANELHQNDWAVCFKVGGHRAFKFSAFEPLSERRHCVQRTVDCVQLGWNATAPKHALQHLRNDRRPLPIRCRQIFSQPGALQ